MRVDVARVAVLRAHGCATCGPFLEILDARAVPLWSFRINPGSRSNTIVLVGWRSCCCAMFLDRHVQILGSQFLDCPHARSVCFWKHMSWQLIALVEDVTQPCRSLVAALSRAACRRLVAGLSQACRRPCRRLSQACRRLVAFAEQGAPSACAGLNKSRQKQRTALGLAHYVFLSPG